MGQQRGCRKSVCIESNLANDSLESKSVVAAGADRERAISIWHKTRGSAGNPGAVHVDVSLGAVVHRGHMIPLAWHRCSAGYNVQGRVQLILIVHSEVPSIGALINEPA